MKKIILIISICISAFLAQAQTFHGIIFANTHDAKIGESVCINYYKMQNEFAAIAPAIEMENAQHYYKGLEYNKTKLMEVLSKIKFSEKDIVFFYHTGHGGRAESDKTKWPQLALGHYDDAFVSLNRVLEMLKNKSPQPQLIVVMSQSCNSIVDGLSAKEGVSGGSTTIENNNKQNYNKLFRNLKGTIIVSSSSPGEYSWSNSEYGSYFTDAFLTELGKMVSGNSTVNWETLFKNTSKTKYQNLGKSNSNPQWEVNVSNASGGGNTTKPKKTSTDDFVNQLLTLADSDRDEMSRINMVNPLLNKYFESNFAKVEIIGKNGRTLVERQPAEKFIKRLSTTRRLTNVAILEKKTNSSGKITELKIHEIYKK